MPNVPSTTGLILPTPMGMLHLPCTSTIGAQNAYGQLKEEFNMANWLYNLCTQMTPSVKAAEGLKQVGVELYGITRNGVDKAIQMGWYKPTQLDALHRYITSSPAIAGQWVPYILYAHAALGLHKHPDVLRACRNLGDVAYLIDVMWQYGYGYSSSFYLAALERDPFAGKPGGARRAAMRQQLRRTAWRTA